MLLVVVRGGTAQSIRKALTFARELRKFNDKICWYISVHELRFLEFLLIYIGEQPHHPGCQLQKWRFCLGFPSKNVILVVTDIHPEVGGVNPIGICCWYCWWFRNPANQLIWQIFHYLPGFIHPGGFSWFLPSTVSTTFISWPKNIQPISLLGLGRASTARGLLYPLGTIDFGRDVGRLNWEPNWDPVGSDSLSFFCSRCWPSRAPPETNSEFTWKSPTGWGWKMKFPFGVGMAVLLLVSGIQWGPWVTTLLFLGGPKSKSGMGPDSCCPTFWYSLNSLPTCLQQQEDPLSELFFRIKKRWRFRWRKHAKPMSCCWKNNLPTNL